MWKFSLFMPVNWEGLTSSGGTSTRNKQREAESSEDPITTSSCLQKGQIRSSTVSMGRNFMTDQVTSFVYNLQWLLLEIKTWTKKLESSNKPGSPFAQFCCQHWTVFVEWFCTGSSLGRAASSPDTVSVDTDQLLIQSLLPPEWCWIWWTEGVQQLGQERCMSLYLLTQSYQVYSPFPLSPIQSVKSASFQPHGAKLCPMSQAPFCVLASEAKWR